MQNTFSFSRFGRLFNKHTAENYKANLMSAVVACGILGLIMGLVAYFNPYPINKELQGVFYILGLLFLGSIFTSMIFTDLSDKKSAIATLTLPASHFEKYFLGWFYSFVIFIVVYTLCFYLVDIIVVNMDNWQGKTKEIVNIFSNKEEEEIYGVFVVYIFLHALCIWGAIYFQKLHFIKTGFTLFLGIAVLSLINYFFMKAYIGDNVQAAIPFGSFIIEESEKNSTSISLPETYQHIVGIGVVAIAIVLWAASYLRLTEKQV